MAADAAVRTDRTGALDPVVVEALIDSRLAGLIAPRELSRRREPKPAVLVDVIGTIAAGDASVGWCVAISMGVNFLAGYLPPRGGPDTVRRHRPALASAVFAPTGQARTVDDGYELSGRWAFSSGCEHAAVQACGMFVVDHEGRPQLGPDGAPAPRLAFVAASELDIVETWDTAGLRGTGSHDTVAHGVHLASSQTMSFADEPWADGAIYRVPPFCLLASCLASVGLGIGRAALDDFEHGALDEHRQPRRPGARPRFDDDPIGQLDLGRAEVRLRAARLLLIDALEQVRQLGLRGQVPRESVALVGLACSEAIAAGIQAVDVACQLTGSASVRAGRPLERRRRDIDTLRKHQVAWPSHHVPLGRQIAGIPTVAFPLLSLPLTAEERS